MLTSVAGRIIRRPTSVARARVVSAGRPIGRKSSSSGSSSSGEAGAGPAPGGEGSRGRGAYKVRMVSVRRGYCVVHRVGRGCVRLKSQVFWSYLSCVGRTKRRISRGRGLLPTDKELR